MAYTPLPNSSTTLEGLRFYLESELRRISAASVYLQANHLELTTLHASPSKPIEGMIVKADGTDWNPGGGAGIYARVSSAWVKLN